MITLEIEMSAEISNGPSSVPERGCVFVQDTNYDSLGQISMVIINLSHAFNVIHC